MRLNTKLVEKIMRKNKLKVCAFADFIGCSRPTTVRILKEERKPNLIFLTSISNKFNIPIEELIKNGKRKSKAS